MTSTTPRGLAALLLPATMLALAGSPRAAESAVVSLNAAPLSSPMPMPDGTSVAMWGFGLGTDAPTVPGPPIIVPAGDPVLEVTLTNNLAVPVSFVILGQAAPAVDLVDTATTPPAVTPLSPGPTFVNSAGTVVGTGSRPAGSAGDPPRIRSLTREANPGQTVRYRFSGLRPGTYLYESGTHQAVQVQMGLYGAMSKNAVDAIAAPPAVRAQAYPGLAFDTQVTLLYSEVDPALHAAVANGTYGTVSYPSTIGYGPKFFLVNGSPYVAGPPAPAPIPAGTANGVALVRFLNAGLNTHVPTLLGGTLSLVAEDGNPYPHARQQYSVPLPAGKTTDAIFTAPAAGSYPLFDRALALVNGLATDGGMRTVLAVGDSGPAVAADFYSTAEEAPLTVAAPGVLANDGLPGSGGAGLNAALATTTSHGTLSLSPDGGFTYTPAANFAGTDSFAYRAVEGSVQSSLATVTMTVNPVNDPPVAVADSYAATAGVPLAVGSAIGASPQGILLNDSDVDSKALTAVLATGPVGATLALQPNGSFTFTAASAGTYTFSYVASDGSATSPSAFVTIVVTAPVNGPPVAVDDTASTARTVTVDINVLANDSDPDGPLPNVASTVTIVTAPLARYGAATVLANGQIRFVPFRAFRGTAVFTYRARDPQGARSNTATVRVNVN